MVRTRVLAIVAVLSALAGLGGVLGGAALANHQFPDVPPDNAFHDDIDDFANAGCATGFPDGTYRPQDAVKRQQMARFIHACAGRVASAAGTVAPVGATTQLLELEIAPGALQGGGFVMVTAAVRISSIAATGFPCEVQFDLPFSANEEVWLDLPLDTADDIEDTSGAIHTVFPWPAGDPLSIPLNVTLVNGCAAAVSANARATATWWPFDASGDGGGES